MMNKTVEKSLLALIVFFTTLGMLIGWNLYWMLTTLWVWLKPIIHALTA